jgi:anti-sigma factor RsiW
MTENDDRILRLHAALDGELDAMSALELEQAMRADPALAAEYRRLAALREAVRRHARRELAPQGLADRIGTLAAPVDSSNRTCRFVG